MRAGGEYFQSAPAPRIVEVLGRDTEKAKDLGSYKRYFEISAAVEFSDTEETPEFWRVKCVLLCDARIYGRCLRTNHLCFS